MNRGKEKCCYEEEVVYEPEEMECRPHPHPCPGKEQEVILNCGTVTGSAPLTCNPGVSTINGSGYNGGQSAVQASVVLDTSRLVNITAKIDFSTLISFRTTCENYFLHLSFKLSKICGGSCIPLGTWTFEKSYYENYPVNGGVQPEQIQPIYGSLTQTDSFSFIWCECEDCPGCCRYIVELVDQQCYNIEYAVLTNTFLTGMAAGERKYR